MDNFDFELFELSIEEKMEKAVSSYQINMSKISTGRANPQILNSVNVNYYGTQTPINQIANINVPEPRQLLIKPYDISLVKTIVDTINSASLGLNAVDEGDKIRISFPEMTTELRKELVKMLGKYTEQAKVLIRNTRQEANKEIKSSKQSEDIEKRMLDEVQKKTDIFVNKVDQMTSKKTEELTTI